MKENSYKELTDSQCDGFRRLPCNFNDMIRAAYNAGRVAEQERCSDIVYGQCSSDNVAERTTKAIRQAKNKTKFLSPRDS